jgi:hypothetical protein
MQLAIDPGTARTGIVLMDVYQPVFTVIVDREHIRQSINTMLALHGVDHEHGINEILIEKPV